MFQHKQVLNSLASFVKSIIRLVFTCEYHQWPHNTESKYNDVKHFYKILL